MSGNEFPLYHPAGIITNYMIFAKYKDVWNKLPICISTKKGLKISPELRALPYEDKLKEVGWQN